MFNYYHLMPITLLSTFIFTYIFTYLLLIAELFLSTVLPGLRTIKSIKLLSATTRRRKPIDPSLRPENLLSYWVIYALLQFIPWARVPYDRHIRFVIYAALQLSMFEGQYGYMILYNLALKPVFLNYEKITNTMLSGADYVASTSEAIARGIIEQLGTLYSLYRATSSS